MNSKRALTLLVAVAALVVAIPATAGATKPPRGPVVSELVSFAAPGCIGGCGSGSTVGPDRALYVTDGPRGRVLRVDPRTGAVTTFARGLPAAIPAVGIGGAMDVAFAGRNAYVLVTLVGPEFGQPDVVAGLYRIGRNGSATAIADIGEWSVANPPATLSLSPAESSTRSRSSGAGCWSQTATTTAYCTSGATVTSANWPRSATSSPPASTVQGRNIYMGQAGPIRTSPETARS